MSWTYKTKKIGDITQFPENTFGFVYIVTHKPSGKSYIGKKVLYHTRKVKIGKRELEQLQGVVGRRPAYKLAGIMYPKRVEQNIGLIMTNFLLMGLIQTPLEPNLIELML